MEVPWRRERGLLSGEVREGWTQEVTCELGLRTSRDIPGIYKDWRELPGAPVRRLTDKQESAHGGM